MIRLDEEVLHHMSFHVIGDDFCSLCKKCSFAAFTLAPLDPLAEPFVRAPLAQRSLSGSFFCSSKLSTLLLSVQLLLSLIILRSNSSIVKLQKHFRLMKMVFSYHAPPDPGTLQTFSGGLLSITQELNNRMCQLDGEIIELAGALAEVILQKLEYLVGSKGPHSGLLPRLLDDVCLQ